MATLFLGRRMGAEGFSRHVAIKVVHEHLASDPTFVQMFVDEALLSARIHHPNVVHVEELRELGGRHYLVMEYVHGCALSTLLGTLGRRRRTMSPELATYIAVKVAEGLHAAHEAQGADGQPLGVVHRDVTPQNVLLAYRGHVKLIDFGVAKARGRAQQTTGASLKGKIGYMSPEQAFGRPVDRRTDIYALGVVLWEMLTGRRAFDADNDLALLEIVRDPKVAPARTFNPAVPPALDAVIQKAMARDPSQRFETAQQLRKALATAVPSALALDASDLEQLLAAAMIDEIESERRALPDSLTGIVSGVLARSAPEAEEIVGTLTVSVTGLASIADEPSPVVTSPSGTLVLDEAEPPVPAPAAPAPRLNGLALVLLLGLGVLAVAVTGVFVWVLVAPKPEMRARELPRNDDAREHAAAAPAAERPAPLQVPTEPAAQAPPEDEDHVAEEPAENAAATAEPPAEHVAHSEPEPAEEAPLRQTERSQAHRRGHPRRSRTTHRSSGGGVPLADEF